MFALPTAAMTGLTIYVNNVHEGASNARSGAIGLIYGMLPSSFFIFV